MNHYRGDRFSSYGNSHQYEIYARTIEIEFEWRFYDLMSAFKPLGPSSGREHVHVYNLFNLVMVIT